MKHPRIPNGGQMIDMQFMISMSILQLPTPSTTNSWTLPRLGPRILPKGMHMQVVVEESQESKSLLTRAKVWANSNFHLATKLTVSAWRLGNIEYAEDKYRDFEGDLFGGKVGMYWRETCFCWCFWSLDIPVSDLENSSALLVRAMDEALSIQPRDMYWSVLGMMNNSWFRVTITRENGVLKFEHPSHPTMPGGWMERVKKAGGDLMNGNWGELVEGEEPVVPESVPEINMKKDGLNREISLQKLQSHIAQGEPWFVVDGEVYDGTAFLEGHPGGAQSIISSAGLDVSDEFLEIREYT